MKIITNNEKKLVMETNKIFQTLGNYNSIGGGDNFEYIPSKIIEVICMCLMTCMIDILLDNIKN